MSGWQVGDLAVCLVHYNATGLALIRKGELVTVSKVEPAALDEKRKSTACGLQFAAKPGVRRYFYASEYFLKVTPPKEMIEEERKAGVPA